MSFIEEVTGRIQLAEENYKVSGYSSTKDNENAKKTRVSKEELKELPQIDSISFNMLNFYTNMIMKPGFEYVGNSNQFENWLSEIKYYKVNTSIRRLKKELLRDRAKYGAAFLEFVPYKNGKGVADIRRVNSSKIDYARDTYGNIIFDKYGVPFGFVFNQGRKRINEGDVIPQELKKLGFSLKNNQIFLNKNKIAVFPLYKLENNYDYIGLLEPAYQDIKNRIAATDAQVNAIKVKSTSLPIISVGDNIHEPNPQMMSNAGAIIRNLKEATGVVMPNYMKMETLDYKSLDSIENTIKMLLYSSSSASGIPLAALTGMGEATNRATLNKLMESTIAILQSQINDFVEDWNYLVVDRIMAENNFSGKVQLKWNGIRYEDRTEETKVMLETIKLGKISDKEYRNWLQKTWFIELDEKTYSKEKEEKSNSIPAENFEKEEKDTTSK